MGVNRFGAFVDFLPVRIGWSARPLVNDCQEIVRRDTDDDHGAALVDEFVCTVDEHRD